MLVLSSQHWLISASFVVRLCNQEAITSFPNGPNSEKSKLRRWWTFLSQLEIIGLRYTRYQEQKRRFHQVEEL